MFSANFHDRIFDTNNLKIKNASFAALGDSSGICIRTDLFFVLRSQELVVSLSDPVFSGGLSRLGAHPVRIGKFIDTLWSEIIGGGHANEVDCHHLLAIIL